MAQAYNAGGVFSSQLIGVPESYDQQMGVLALREAIALAILAPDFGASNPIGSHTHKYNDMVWTPAQTKLTSTITNSSTSLALDDAVASEGMLIRINEETILLGTESPAKTFDVTSGRSVNAGSAAGHTAAELVSILGKPQVQGAAAGTADVVVEPDEITNYIECFAKFIMVPDATEGLPQHFRPGQSRFDYELNQNQIVALHELEHSLFWGTARAPSTNATAGKMGGIWDRMYSYTTDLGDSALSLDNMRTAVRSSGNYGGAAKLYFFANLYTCDTVDSWQIPHVQVQQGSPESQNFGVAVRNVLVGGKNIVLVPYPQAAADCFLLDATKIRLRQLAGHGWTLKMEGREGLRTKWDLSYYGTAEIKCAPAHYVFTSVKQS